MRIIHMRLQIWFDTYKIEKWGRFGLPNDTSFREFRTNLTGGHENKGNCNLNESFGFYQIYKFMLISSYHFDSYMVYLSAMRLAVRFEVTIMLKPILINIFSDKYLCSFVFNAFQWYIRNNVKHQRKSNLLIIKNNEE